MVYHAHVSGESTRKGFYVYDDRRKANPDPELKKYIEKSRSISGVTIDPKVSLFLSCVHTHTPHTLTEFIILLFGLCLTCLLSWGP
jgi:hypothetical protein